MIPLTVTDNVDFNGDLDVDGTTNLDVVDIDEVIDKEQYINFRWRFDYI